MIAFHEDLGRELVLLADQFAMLEWLTVACAEDAWRFELIADLFFGQAMYLREIGKVVKLAAGQPL